MPSLVVHTPNGTIATYPLTSAPMRVGRSENCDIVLRDDAEVSRVHAEIWVDEQGRVVVEDKGSKNGTRVDTSEAFRGERRFAFDVVHLGEHELRLTDTAVADPTVRFAADEPTEMGETQFFPSTRGFDLNQHRLELLINLTARIGGVFERKQLLEQALDACCEALHFERGLIVLKTPRGDTESPVTRNVQRDESGAFKISRTLINKALVDGDRAVVNNPATDLIGNMSESLVRFPIRSALCVPILFREEVLGVIYGDRITQGSTYTESDVNFLAAIAQQVGVGIINLRLFQEHVRSQRMYAELDQARTIQRRLLPEGNYRRGRIVVEGYNQPSSAVSGDLYDFFRVTDTRLGVVIADVTGHGLPAALVMATVQSALRVALSPEISLPALARRVNRLIYEHTSSEKFVTGIIGLLDTQTGAFEYVVAGHPPPIVFDENGPRIMSDEVNGLPLGVVEDADYEPVLIDPGRIRAALLYTDGLIEAESGDGELLGVEAVVEALKKTPDLSPGALLRTARQALAQHMPAKADNDDMTLLALQFVDE